MTHADSSSTPSTLSTAPFTDLRRWLTHLHDTGRLAIIREGTPLKHTLAAIAKRLDGRQAAYFPKPGGHNVPVVSGLMSRRAWIAEAMGVPESELLQRFRHASDNPLRWREVPQGEAPCQQVVHRDRDAREVLPIPTHSEHDNGPYITAGLVIARNPKTGVEVPILPRRVLVFRPSQVLKAHVNHTAVPLGDDE
mgnify:CR=1 FL=1